MNKWFFLLPLACLAGFIVGSWGARADLRALKELEKVPVDKLVDARYAKFRAMGNFYK